MLYRRIFIILFFLGLLSILGCYPVSHIETETLEPAEIAVPQKINSGVLLLKQPVNDFARIEQENFPSKILEEVKYGMADVLANSPRFSGEQIKIPENGEIQEFTKKDTLTWIDMKRITDKFNVDVVIMMDYLSMNDKLEDKYATKKGFIQYYLKFEIISKAHWKIYYPYQDLMVDDYSYSEKFVWEAMDPDKRMAIELLPDYDKTFREAAYWTGYDYAKRILPTWQKNTRSYYSRGTEKLRKGAEMVENNKWEKAIEIWKDNLKHSDAEVVSRAAYNIAFAFEMMGKIDLAIQWAEKSLSVKNKKRTRKYLDKLTDRKKKLSRLEEQID